MVVELSLAVIFAVVTAVTVVVEMLNVPEVAPAGMDKDGRGDATDDAELESETLNAAGAAAMRSTSLLDAVRPP